MTTLFRIKIITVLFLILGSLSLRADPISGTYSNDCSGLLKLWDLTGTYNSTNDTETDLLVLNMDATGNITGTGHFDFTDTGGALHGDFTASGKVSSAGSVTRVKLTFVSTSGTGNIQGHDVTFQAKLNENLEIDDNSRMLVGNETGKIKVTVVDLGITKSKSIPSTPSSQPLPDEVDGAWGLFQDAGLAGTKYTGASLLQLSNGKIFGLAVGGSYSSKTDLSKVSLKSTDKSTPITLNVVEQNFGGTLSILSLKGKALGQNLQFTQ